MEEELLLHGLAGIGCTTGRQGDRTLGRLAQPSLGSTQPLIKCQLTLGGVAQATMHDWVGMNGCGWNMCEEYILFTT